MRLFQFTAHRLSPFQFAGILKHMQYLEHGDETGFVQAGELKLCIKEEIKRMAGN